MTIDEFRALCDLTVKLTELRIKETPHLCVENFAPELLSKLMSGISPGQTAPPSIFGLGLPHTAVKELMANGVLDTGVLLTMRQNDLLKLPNFGRKTLTDTIEALRLRGLKLAD